MDQSRVSRWCFRLDNYTEDGYTELKQRLSTEQEVRYWIIRKEVGQSGASKLEGYVAFKKSWRYKRVKSLVSEQANLEPFNGIEAQKIDYYSKGGSFEEFGRRTAQGIRSDLSTIPQKQLEENNRESDSRVQQHIKVLERELKKARIESRLLEEVLKEIRKGAQSTATQLRLDIEIEKRNAHAYLSELEEHKRMLKQSQEEVQQLEEKLLSMRTKEDELKQKKIFDLSGQLEPVRREAEGFKGQIELKDSSLEQTQTTMNNLPSLLETWDHDFVTQTNQGKELFMHNVDASSAELGRTEHPSSGAFGGSFLLNTNSSLQQDNEFRPTVMSPSAPSTESACILCQESKAQVIFMPCFHCILCSTCCERFNYAPSYYLRNTQQNKNNKFCPSCRVPIQSISKPKTAVLVRPKVYSAACFF